MRSYRVTLNEAGQTRHEHFIAKNWWSVYQHARRAYGKAVAAITPLRKQQAAKERP